MTVATERLQALVRTRKFLKDMLWDQELPEKYRDEAYKCLKHFPWDCHLDDLSEQSPHILEKK